MYIINLFIANISNENSLRKLNVAKKKKKEETLI